MFAKADLAKKHAEEKCLTEESKKNKYSQDESPQEKETSKFTRGRYRLVSELSGSRVGLDDKYDDMVSVFREG